MSNDVKRGRETAPGFGLYVHWPFCAAKCPYCDFNSHVRAGVDHDAWAAALVAEMEYAASRADKAQVTSIFFGGGTPSLMKPATVARIIERAEALWGFAPDVEITMEANPTSVEADAFAAYANAGVARLSLGVQALRDADLRALGRLHSVEEARAALALARQTFAQVSFDLIYAREGQTLEAWESELREALTFAPDHLSLYQLTLEPGTAFYERAQRGTLNLPNEDACADMFAATQDICAGAGLPAYEVSNHARPGAECRHNLTYWRLGDYVGVGPGAHGRVSARGNRFATETLRLPEDWLAAVAQSGHGYHPWTEVPPPECGEEYLMMALRLREGASLARYQDFTGRPLDIGPADELAQQGFVTVTADRLTVTPKGMPLLNRLIAEIVA